MRIGAATRSRVAGLLVVTATVALAGPIKRTTPWNNAGACPACLCSKAIAEVREGAKTSDFSGCLSGVDQLKGFIRVRIIPLRSGEASATRADTEGQFSFRNVRNGDYVLLVTEDEKPLALNMIRVPLNTPIWVDVEPRPTRVAQVYY